MDRKHLGSSFEDFLREEGTLEETTSRAIKRVLARQLQKLMHENGLSKSEMARRMQTSRPALERLLDPDNDSVTLNTLQKAAKAVGRELRLENRTKDIELTVRHGLSKRQVDVMLKGGLINWMRERLEEQAG